MGNCSSNPSSRLEIFSKSGDPEEETWTDGVDSPYTNRIHSLHSSDARPGPDISPVALTPPQRSSLVGSEVFRPRPQSEEPKAARKIDAFDIVTHPLFDKSFTWQSDDEVEPTIGVDEAARNSGISNSGHVLTPDMKVSNASPKAVAKSEGVHQKVDVTTEMKKSTHSPLATLIPESNTLGLTESSLINIITIESKQAMVDSSCSNMSELKNLSTTTCDFMPDTTEIKGTNIGEQFVFQGNQRDQGWHKKASPCNREHKKMARFALLLLFLFYSVCLACIGWLGARTLHSARMILLPRPKLIQDSLGKNVDSF